MDLLRNGAPLRSKCAVVSIPEGTGWQDMAHQIRTRSHFWSHLTCFVRRTNHVPRDFFVPSLFIRDISPTKSILCNGPNLELI